MSSCRPTWVSACGWEAMERPPALRAARVGLRGGVGGDGQPVRRRHGPAEALDAGGLRRPLLGGEVAGLHVRAGPLVADGVGDDADARAARPARAPADA